MLPLNLETYDIDCWSLYRDFIVKVRYFLPPYQSNDTSCRLLVNIFPNFHVGTYFARKVSENTFSGRIPQLHYSHCHRSKISTRTGSDDTLELPARNSKTFICILSFMLGTEVLATVELYVSVKRWLHTPIMRNFTYIPPY